MIFREVEDRDLIPRARRGDVEAFNILVSRWEKRVYNYLLRTVRHREDALDLCQDTFLKVYRNLGKLDDVERFPRWLFRIAHNESISMFRRKKFTSDEEVPELAEAAPVVVAGARIYPIELSLAVAKALDGLSDDQRQVVLLKVYQGFKFHEIAEILGCPASTVKSRLYSAFEVLKETLAPVDRPAG